MKTENNCNRQVFWFPEQDDLVEENPPCFAFVRPVSGKEYTVVVEDERGNNVYTASTTKNYAVPDFLLSAGRYRWRVFSDGWTGEWRNFYLSAEAVEFLRPSAQMVWDSIPDCHPRHLFYEKDIPEILRTKGPQIETLRRNIALALERPLPAPPAYHWDKGALPYREYFGLFRSYCDRDMVACALGYALLKDEKAGEKARQLLLVICGWNPAGPCGVDYPWNDEIGLSCSRCMPAVYDLIWELLDEPQRYLVEQTIFQYALQCEKRLRATDYTENPANSHVGRIPAYMAEGAIALKGCKWIDQTVLQGWLAYALEIYGGIFPFFGTPDGGWAEGPFYATSYIKWYLPFFAAVERFSGVRFLDRPFYQRVSQFLLHFADPRRENHPFGDGYWCCSEDTEWPGFFAQNPLGLYAQRFGPLQARELEEKYAAPEVFQLHLLDVFIPCGCPPEKSLTGPAQKMAVFPKAGLASCQTMPWEEGDNHVLLVRASRYGSISHQHADQGDFALFVNDTAMISPSGYYGRKFGTLHHRQWTQTTQAHNCILIDGVGQPVGSRQATGQFTAWKYENEHFELTADLTAAYPLLRRYHRNFWFDKNELVIEDVWQAEEAHTMQWLFHTLSKPEVLPDGSVLICRQGNRVRVCPDANFQQQVLVKDEFSTPVNAGEPPAYWVEMPRQYHICFQLPAGKSCRSVVRIVCESKEQENEV